MLRVFLSFIGFLFICAGSLLFYHYFSDNPGLFTNILNLEKRLNKPWDGRTARLIREAEGYLDSDSKESAIEAMKILNGIDTVSLSEQEKLRILLNRAIAFENMGNLQRATEIFRDLEQKQITNKELKNRIHFFIGRNSIRQNDETKGMSYFAPLLSGSSPNHLKAKVYTEIGNFHFRSQEYVKAIKHYQLALDHNSDFIDAHEGISLTLKAQLVGDVSLDLIFQYLYDIAGDNIRFSKERKIQLLRTLIDAIFRKATEVYRKKEREKALDYFTRLRKIYSDANIIDLAIIDETLQDEIYYHLGEIYWRKNQIASAIQCYENILLNRNTHLDQIALIQQGILYIETHKLRKAEKSLQEATDNYPRGEHIEKAKAWQKELNIILKNKEIFKRYK